MLSEISCRRRFGLLLVLAAELIAGCGVPGAARPTSTDAVPPAAMPTPDAAIVREPKDATQVAGRPCDVLSSNDVRQLGLGLPGRQRQSVGALECRWAADDGQDLSLLLDVDRDLLGDAYRTEWRGVSTASSIDSYPALRRKTGRGEFNTCTVIVRLGERQALTADWVGRGEPGPGNDACQFAEQAAALVIRKLPPAG